MPVWPPFKPVDRPTRCCAWRSLLATVSVAFPDEKRPCASSLGRLGLTRACSGRATEGHNLRVCTEAMALALKHSAGQELRKVTLQLSPLRPLQPCQVKPPVVKDFGGHAAMADSFPSLAIAATSLARVAIELISSPAGGSVPEGAACSHALSEDSEWVAHGVPGGFDAELALRCAELSALTYLSTECEAPAAALKRKLAAGGLQLVAELCNAETEVYAIVARNESSVFVSFRGSATVKNLMTDLDYGNDAAASLEYHRHCASHGLVSSTGLSLLPDKPWPLHGGFVKAYLSLRPQLVEVLDKLDELDLYMTGAPSPQSRATLAIRLGRTRRASTLSDLRRSLNGRCHRGPRLARLQARGPHRLRLAASARSAPPHLQLRLAARGRCRLCLLLRARLQCSRGPLGAPGALRRRTPPPVRRLGL